MTRVVAGEELVAIVAERYPQACLEWHGDSLWVEPAALNDVCRLLKEDDRLAFDFLSAVSAVDYIHYFELVYHLTSLRRNYSAVVKAKLHGREAPEAPSVTDIWPGADFQEREIYDLMGVSFTGHPNLKRIMLWEGFPGHPHRKDFEDAVSY